MSFFSRIFGDKKPSSKGEEKNYPPSPEFQRLIGFGKELQKLLNSDRYLARSDYRSLVVKYSDVRTFFENLQTAKVLNIYCEQHGLELNRVEKALSIIHELDNLKESAGIIQSHNEEFLQKHLESDKEYLDTILSKVDPNIVLDQEQRKVVLSDEDYTLVVAGAGAGKTTTMAAKVKYLVEKKHVLPKDIVVISFTNKAVGELNDKICKALKINCPVSTFHKTGYSILRKEGPKNIKDEGFMVSVITEFLKKDVLKKPEMVDKLILLFGTYFDAPDDGENLAAFFNYISKSDFTTMRSILDEDMQTIADKRARKAITINYETLRSSQEVAIANFLYLNNVDYSYEAPYPYSFPGSRRPYTPDFTIKQNGKTVYIEHFGINEDGTHNRFTPEQLETYKKWINKKIRFHREHNTKLVYTFSKFNDGIPFLDHLKQSLEKEGIVMTPKSPQEVYEKIVSTEENKYISKLVRLICQFIHNFKANGYSDNDFKIMRQKSNNVRTELFLDVCRQCYLEYALRLEDANAVDFEDMINLSASILRQEKEKGTKLSYKYIIIDEYQDISRQRFNLAKELSEICDAKIIAVGDDWQSIFAYAGSDISLFTQFSDIMGYGEELKITKTYRNSQEIIDIAGSFIQKNTSQIKKSLISPKHLERPVIIEAYSEEQEEKDADKNGKLLFLGQAVEKVIGQILENNNAEGKPANSSILLIGRYGFDAFNLSRSSLFKYDENSGKVISTKYPEANLTFLTAHRSKGLGFDNVVIINALNATYGFPSKVEDDPVMQLVIHNDRTIDYAEERRLFYVALTRTKNRVYIVVPRTRASRFVAELVQDYPNVCVKGNLDIDKTVTPDISMVKRCPVCGYPLQYKYKKGFGKPLWICTNEPEICEFMTNNLAGGILSVIKCDCCNDGYLVVKKGQYEMILGCTNYKKDKTGCNNIKNLDDYRKYMKL